MGPLVINKAINASFRSWVDFKNLRNLRKNYQHKPGLEEIRRAQTWKNSIGIRSRGGGNWVRRLFVNPNCHTKTLPGAGTTRV